MMSTFIMVFVMIAEFPAFVPVPKAEFVQLGLLNV